MIKDTLLRKVVERMANNLGYYIFWENNGEMNLHGHSNSISAASDKIRNEVLEEKIDALAKHLGLEFYGVPPKWEDAQTKVKKIGETV